MSAVRSDSRYSNRDVENSISFLQAEHAKILDGLHEQIRSLQQKCTQLTFELAMQSSAFQEPASEQSNDSRTATYLKESATVEMHSLQPAITGRESKMAALEEELKHVHEELLCERKAKTELSQKLHTKADTIANLMTQLHKEKQKSKKVMEQLKLYGDSNFDQSPSLSMKSGKTKMTVKYPSNSHHTNEPLPETATTVRDMPRPPTTPPPDVSSSHIRRATTPSKDLASQRRSGFSASSSARRKLPTVPQGTSFYDAQTRNPEQLRNSAEWALNPLRKEEAPGYQDLIKSQQSAHVRPPSRQFPILPPIEGQIPPKGKNLEEEESSVYHQTIKPQQAKINPPIRLEPSGQQAWVKRLSPQSQSDSQ